MDRRQFIATSLAATMASPALADARGFGTWIANFRSRANAAGISDRTFDAAFQGARYLQDSIDRDRNQSEFVKPFADYMGTAASDDRVRNGRVMLRQHGRLLSRIEATYAVEPHVVLAVWGMESNYGQRRGDTPLISTLSAILLRSARSISSSRSRRIS